MHDTWVSNPFSQRKHKGVGGNKKDRNVLLLEVLSSFMCTSHLGPYHLAIKAFFQGKTPREGRLEKMSECFMPRYLSVSKEVLPLWLAKNRLAT